MIKTISLRSLRLTLVSVRGIRSVPHSSFRHRPDRLRAPNPNQRRRCGIRLTDGTLIRLRHFSTEEKAATWDLGLCPSPLGEKVLKADEGALRQQVPGRRPFTQR